MFFPLPYRNIIALSAPIAGIQFAQVALTSTDLMMMGRVGLEAVAAGGLAILLYNQLRTMCVGMVTGLGNLVATAVGRGEKRAGNAEIDAVTREEVRDLVHSSLSLATVIALAAGGLLIALSYALSFLGQDITVAEHARPVMIALAPGLLPMLWLNVLRQFAVGMRRPGSLLRVTLISIIVNAVLEAALLYGWLGLPQLGLVGIGLSTTLVQVLTLVVFFRAVRQDRRLRDLLSVDFWQARLATILRIIRMGTPISLTYGSEAAITSIATLLMGTFGPVVLAASNITNQLTYIVYQLNIGLSQGSSILVSRAIGREDYNEIQAVAKRALTVSFAVMTVIGIIYVFLPELVLAPFLGTENDPAVLTLAASLLWFAIVHQFSKGSQNICIGLLRGLGNTKAGLTHTLIGYWGIGIPTMTLCGYPLSLGGKGVWFGLCLGFSVTSLLLWRRFMTDLKRISPKNISKSNY